MISSTIRAACGHLLVGGEMLRGVFVILTVYCLIPESLSSQAAVFELSTADHRFRTGVNNQGFWSPTLINVDINDNYYCGLNSSGQHRSFFTFFAPILNPNETIVSAVLAPPRGGYNSLSVEIQLFHVATSAVILNNNTGSSLPIYQDLGSGPSYGSAVVPGTGLPNDPVLIPLNSQGIADLLASAGNYFSIGARLADESLHIFSNTDYKTVKLIVTTVPEPMPIVFAYFYSIGLLFVRGRRSKKELIHM